MIIYKIHSLIVYFGSLPTSFDKEPKLANKANSLAHTKWLCKYHIVFTPKYRRKIIYNQYRASIQEIIKRLCKYKGAKDI